MYWMWTSNSHSFALATGLVDAACKAIDALVRMEVNLDDCATTPTFKFHCSYSAQAQ